jgi:uncharacterized protein YkwD
LLVGCPPATDPTLGALRVVNNSSHAITAFFFSPSTSTTFGTSVISSSIGAGASRTIGNIPPGVEHDFKADFANGGTAEVFQVLFDPDETLQWDLGNEDIVGGSNASADVLAKELAAHDQINGERTSRGIAALTLREDLRLVARAHSEDMIARGFFDHDNPDGLDPFERMGNAGITFSTAAENIATNTGFGASSVSAAVNGWMNSDGHRNNILNADFTHTGMGVATDGAGKFMYTQVFIGGGKDGIERLHPKVLSY